MKDKAVIVIEHATEGLSWHLGYIDGEPAVGDAQGTWYKVNPNTVLRQPGAQLVWFLEEGQWSCMHEMHWNWSQSPETQPETIKDTVPEGTGFPPEEGSPGP